MDCPIEDLEDIPEIPLYYRHVWDWFLDLNQSRNSGGSLSYADIYAYFQVMGINADRDDVRALKILDSLYIEAVNTEN